ncbi:beta-1,6-N-acetylglucosaminyltransferase [Chitinophaga solisilvae]|uniref:Peptide O-xylosyltransferase n=1 Tax=Chitinophaga solisilvae TaxID=1233460 RepID=A0A433WH89_9BACT|nr:beta-1,6-N-acetylglucosaminyltransferase [Chitinophaga solisilvae]NSL86687.1 glycosyl transferase [Chitinophaga solisilvae]
MKLAFIILAHKHPAQVKRLLQRLSHPAVHCYLHIDLKCNLQDWQEVINLPQVFPVRERVNVIWAGWSICQATLNSMHAVVQTGVAYDYITLLSGQDYALQPIPDIIRFLEQHPGQQFLNVISDEALQPMMSKMDHYHFVEYNLTGKYMLGRWLTRLLPARKPPYGLKLYCGDAWWTLSLDCVTYCLRYEKEHPSLQRYFKLTWGSDEFILPTILMNSPFAAQIAKHSLHYIDWSAGKEHPKTFDTTDVPALLGSGRPFARKFDLTQAPEIFDKIDGI